MTDEPTLEIEGMHLPLHTISNVRPFEGYPDHRLINLEYERKEYVRYRKSPAARSAYVATKMSTDFIVTKPEDVARIDEAFPPPPVEPDVWSSDETYPVEQWQHEVSEDDTRLGYWDWVKAQKEMNA